MAAARGPPQFADCIGIVDATYIRVQRPKNPELERRLYSTYKKYHAVFFIVIVDRDGKLRKRKRSARHALTCSPLLLLARFHSLRGRRQLAQGKQ